MKIKTTALQAPFTHRRETVVACELAMVVISPKLLFLNKIVSLFSTTKSMGLHITPSLNATYFFLKLHHQSTKQNFNTKNPRITQSPTFVDRKNMISAEFPRGDKSYESKSFCTFHGVHDGIAVLSKPMERFRD